MGSAVLITATMAGVSMTFALHSALKVPLAAAIPFAVAWGLAIMSLDRWLVVSLVRQQNKLNYLLLALPRVALAILFGLIISTPFTLKIFQPEIEHEITQLQDQATAAYYKNLPASPLSREITAAERKVGTLQAEAAGTGTGTSNAQSPELMSLIQQRKQAVTNQDSAYNSWQCQLYGYGPCKPGRGPLATADEAKYNSYVAQVARLNTQISQLQQQQETATKKQQGLVSNTASAQLAQARQVVKADKAEQQRETNDFLAKNKGDTGLLIRLKALDAVTNHDSTLNAARWLLFLFFTAIECLPVLVKVLLNLGPQTSYEKALAYTEQAGLQLVEQETLLQRREARLESDSLSDEAERLRAEWQANALPEIIHDTTAARERVARSRLQRWERRETVGIDDDGFIGPGGLSGTGRLMGTDWTVTRRSRRPRSPAMTPQRWPARQARRNMKAPHQPARSSAWPYWPDSL